MSQPRFIRVHGRVVPVRQKSDGNVDKRHVSNRALATAASKKKASGKRIVKGAAIGGAAGAAFGIITSPHTITRNVRIGKATVLNAKTTVSAAKRALKPGLIGALLGALAASVTMTSKQEVANKLKRRKKK